MEIKAAIVGYGGMGHYHHKEMPKDAGIRVDAVYDINPKKMEEARQKGLRTFSSLEELLADPSISLVIVATPNNFHKEIVVRALGAGKNVVCEKPAALDSGEFAEMMEAAKKSGKVFTVHQNRRWDTDFNIVKKAVEESLIGTPFYIESRVQGANGVPGDWRCVKEAGGGMMLDWGIHLLDQMMFLVKSPVTSVYTHMLSVKFKDVDDNFKLLLRFENGLSALIEVDTFCFEPLPRWHVSGDGGTLVVRDWACNGSVTRAKTLEMKYEPSIVYTASGPTKTMAPRPVESIEKLPLPEVHTDWGDYYRNLAKVITCGGEVLVKPEETLRVMKVVDRVFESARTGECVHCRI